MSRSTAGHSAFTKRILRAQTTPETIRSRCFSNNNAVPVEKPKPGRTPRGPRNTEAWSPEIDDMILSLRNANRTWEYIGLATKRSPSVCSDRYYTTLDPALKSWTPAMFSKLDQMVDDGRPWSEIAAVLNSKIVTCQHQWRTLGKGTYRVKGVFSATHPLNWKPNEVEGFWHAWIKHGPQNWKAFAAQIRTKNAGDCKKNFKPLVLSACKDAPGWVKLEVFNYVTNTIKAARARRKRGTEMLSKNGSAGQDGSSMMWTPAEHEALLKAVEKFGLFSGWTSIRKEVKPNLDDDEVEAEYYKLNGVAIKQEAPSAKTGDLKSVEDAWSEEEIQKLNTMLMKYSSDPFWVEQAAVHGITPSDSDYENLFADGQKEEAPKKSKKNKSKKVPVSTTSTSSSTTEERATTTNSSAEGVDTRRIWSKLRISRLKRLVGQQRQQERATGQPINWPWIAEHIGPGIDAGMCITQWQSLPDHDTGPLLEPAKFWGDWDTEQLVKGIAAHGRAWALIQTNYLSHRTTDSIRRKFSNVQNKRDAIVKDHEEIAVRLKRNDETELSAEEYVKQALKDHPVLVLAKRMEDAVKQYEKECKALAMAAKTTKE
ncbi:hypothetical protein BGX28_000738 [Mortierella sp. GBA30]|nr:hypothetical protein BGX28_000738 [Mortierella sp. GBA30]